MADDLPALPAEELERRVQELRALMRPLELQLADLRARREVLLTEQRRRERAGRREMRASLKEAMGAGAVPSLADLVAAAGEGSLDGFRWHLRTGGEVRLGFPGARRQTLTFTDGRQSSQAHDLREAAELYAAGWEPGSPGRPGVRVHFPGTRQERLVEPGEVFAHPRDGS